MPQVYLIFHLHWCFVTSHAFNSITIGWSLSSIPHTGGVQGVVPINEVSVAYTQLLKTWSDAASSTPEDEIFTMEKMFVKGSILRVKVLSTVQDKKDAGMSWRRTQLNTIQFDLLKLTVKSYALIILSSSDQMLRCD